MCQSDDGQVGSDWETKVVPAAVREPQRNTAMANCDKELKTLPKTRTASKRTLSTEKEPQAKKWSATGSSPMRSDGRFDTVSQGNLDEMKGHHDTSEHEDYAAEKDEIGFEDGTEGHDDGSETSEKVGHLAQAATTKSRRIWGRIEREDWGYEKGDDNDVRIG
jgi:hypothetical protein